MSRMVPRGVEVGGMVRVAMNAFFPPFDVTAGLRRPLTSDEARWLTCAAHMAAEGKKAARPLAGMAAGRVALGRGAGGDHTLEIDRACETAIRRVLEREAPASYLLVSEETGVGGSEDAPWRVVVDPLDGSLNAKRGLEPYCASIAIAQGETLGDVSIAYVEDYTRPRCFAAVQGVGLVCPGTAPGVCTEKAQESVSAVVSSGYRAEPAGVVGGLVEVVLLEAGRPDRYHFGYHDLSTIGAVGRSQDMRVRQIGSLALALCYVAIAVADILLAAVPARSVDIAAGLRILSEAGGGAAALTDQDIWAQPLDLEKRSAFVAWRAGLDQVEVVSRARELSKNLLVVT